MNDKLRFIIWTLLMIVLFPYTALMFLIFWLTNDWSMIDMYTNFYYKAWRKR